MKHPSASNAESFVMCTASHVLPQHESYDSNNIGGTSGHTLLANLVNGIPGAGLALEKAYPGSVSALSQRMAGVDLPGAEGAYVVDVQSRKSTFLGTNIGRDYAGRLGRPLGDFEIGTSLDLSGIKGLVHWVRDAKFGTYHSWWQLYIQAMAVLWVPGQHLGKEVDAGFLFFEETEKGTRIREDAKTLYLMDLDDRADELMTAFGRARSLDRQLEAGVSPSDIKVVEGPWCKYCGAFPHCPAKWKLAKSMLGMDVVGHVEALTPEQCGSAWLKLKEIEKNIISKMKDALRERMAAEGGFPLANGRRLQVVECVGRSSLDKEATMSLLLEKGATQEEIRDLFRPGKPYDRVSEVKAK